MGQSEAKYKVEGLHLHLYPVRSGNGSTTTLLLKVSHNETLYQTVFALFTKTTNALFEPPLGVRGKVGTSSIARWKSCGRLPIRDN